MHVLLIDNYDSFTFNLKHYLEKLETTVDVIRQDDLEGVDFEKYDRVVLSPGPGLPVESEGMMNFIEKQFAKRPILGICLGMQALSVFFGAEVVNLLKVQHGQVNKVQVDASSVLFKGREECINVGVYHSWEVKIPKNNSLKVTAVNGQGTIMAIEHEELPIYGVQFHPESILTEDGLAVLSNFLNENLDN